MSDLKSVYRIDYLLNQKEEMGFPDRNTKCVIGYYMPEAFFHRPLFSPILTKRELRYRHYFISFETNGLLLIRIRWIGFKVCQDGHLFIPNNEISRKKIHKSYRINNLIIYNHQNDFIKLNLYNRLRNAMWHNETIKWLKR